jgi:energy-converting hydrogenase Eha subunit F
MSHKTIALFALFMAAVFLIIVVVYPMIFNPNQMTPVETPSAPVTAPGPVGK